MRVSGIFPARCNRNLLALRMPPDGRAAKPNRSAEPLRSEGTVCWAGEGDSNAIPFPHTPIPASQRRTRQAQRLASPHSVFGPRTHYKPAAASQAACLGALQYVRVCSPVSNLNVNSSNELTP